MPRLLSPEHRHPDRENQDRDLDEGPLSSPSFPTCRDGDSHRAFCVARGKDSSGSPGPKAHPHLADEQTEPQREGTRPPGPSGPGWVSECCPC